MTTRNKIFFSALSGILLSVAFPPFPNFIATFFAFIPLLFVINNENNDKILSQKTNSNNKINKQRKFPYIYLTFFIYHLSSNWWISTLQENSDIYLFFSGIALDIFHPIFFFFPFLLYFISVRLIGKSLSLWLFPLFWTIFEWLHSIGDLGYSWLSVAHTQFSNIYWYQIVDIAGIWGATFLLLMTNILIYKLIENGKNEAGKYSFKTLFNSIKKKIYVTVICLIIVIPMIYGFLRINEFDYKKQLSENKSLNIGLIQPNINPWEKWESSHFKQIEIHRRLQDSLISSMEKLHLCIWSETAIPLLDLSINRDMRLDFITQDLERTNTSLLAGIVRYYFYQKGEKLPITVKYFQNDTNLPFSSFNAAVLINPKTNFSEKTYQYNKKFDNSNKKNEKNLTVTKNNSNVKNNNSNNSTVTKIYESSAEKLTVSQFPAKNYDLQFHHKAKLTPFAEGFPYVEYFSFAKDWLRWGVGISAWEKGKKTECLEVENSGIKAKIAPIICIESVYPSHVRDFVKNGANILAVITNDAWYNYSYGPEQHYVIAATRAIENRRYLARCANSGVTGFISPTGRTILRAQQYEETAIAASIPILNSDNLTLYSKYGDYLPKFFCILSLLLLVIAYFFRKQ